MCMHGMYRMVSLWTAWKVTFAIAREQRHFVQIPTFVFRQEALWWSQNGLRKVRKTLESDYFYGFFGPSFCYFVTFFLSFLFSQASAEVISMIPAQKEIFWGTAPAISILAKRNVLCYVSQHSKVQVLRWTPFCYTLMNKHKNRTPKISATEDLLQMYTEFIKRKGTNKY